MPIQSKRQQQNRTEWRSGFCRPFTAFGADIDFFTNGPQASSNNLACAEVHFLATAGGNIVLTGLDGINVTLPCAVGWNVFPCQYKKLVSAGTTAVGTMIVYW